MARKKKEINALELSTICYFYSQIIDNVNDIKAFDGKETIINELTNLYEKHFNEYMKLQNEFINKIKEVASENRF